MSHLLDLELNELVHLSEKDKDDIKNLYKMWKSCLDKKIIITNINKGNIRVSNNVICNGQVLWHNIQMYHSLHFINCSDNTIVINPKVNHVVIENCKNINFRLVSGSISGTDIINSTNITCVFNTKNIFFIDISKSTQCSFILSESIAKNIMIITATSFNIDFKIVDDLTGVTKDIYKTNINLFQETTLYSFHIDDCGNISFKRVEL